MPEKPMWLSYAVDVAQIISALFTAGAVIVAIWLARRSESQRPKFRIGRQITLSLGSDGDHEEHAISFAIVNAGVLPITINHAHFHVPLRKGDRWGYGLGEFDPKLNRQTFPLRLEHGEEIVTYVRVRARERPWNVMPFLWWFRSRPEFVATSSLGTTYRVKLSRRLLYAVQRDWISKYESPLI